MGVFVGKQSSHSAGLVEPESCHSLASVSVISQPTDAGLCVWGIRPQQGPAGCTSGFCLQITVTELFSGAKAARLESRSATLSSYQATMMCLGLSLEMPSAA